MPSLLQQLQSAGYASFPLQLCDRVVRALQHITRTALQSQTNRATLRDRRYGYALHYTAFSKLQWRLLFPAAVVEALEGYLESPAELLRVEVLVVEPGAQDQSAHRDHDVGAGKSACVAISINSALAVGTLVLPGSHLTDQEAAGDVQLLPTTSQTLAYDTYMIHAGAGNPTPTAFTHRIFFILRATNMSPREKATLTRHINPTATQAFRPVLLRTLVS